jgi:glycosyltransferase involved in cell wall biosynthesis
VPVAHYEASIAKNFVAHSSLPFIGVGARRITFVLPGYANDPNGGYKVHYQYANAFASQGEHVTIVLPAAISGRPTAKQVLWCLRMARRPPITWFTFHPAIDVRVVPSLRAPFLPRADVTVLTGWQTAELTKKSPRRGVLTQIVYDYEIWMEYPDRRPRIRAALTRPDVHRIATSSIVADMLREMGSEPYATVTAGLADGDFGIDVPIEDRRPVVAFPLRSQPSKDMKTAFAAAEAIRASLPGVTILCFGDPKGESVPPSVQSVGRLGDAELRELYNRCAVFMLTSRHEGWGLPALEAMACGAAVVSTRCGGIEDFVVDGRNGLLSPVGDPTAVAAVVIRLLSNETERVRLGKAGAEDASSMTVTKSARALDAVLDRIIGTT